MRRKRMLDVASLLMLPLGIVIVIAHRPSALAGIDLVLILADGQVQAFGPKDEVLRKSLAARPGSAASAPSSKLVVAADARG